MNKKLDICIRELQVSDIDICISLFHETVHGVNHRDYTQTQLDAWAPRNIDNRERWESLLSNISYVAEVYDQIVGFGDLTRQCYIDRLFVHKNYQRQGIASIIMEKLLQQAKALGMTEIKAESSITAKPFFESHGFQVIKPQEIEIRGVRLQNYLMKKMIRR